MLSSSDHRGFTLIELLVVIAIIAILSVVVVLTLSPAELLRQTRDQNRLSDMDTLTHALGLYTDDAAITSNVSLGTANTVYVSLPDSSSTCGSWNLPLLPSGYAYHCAPLSTLRKTDSTGWIPVNFSSITTGSPLGQLPIDPQNASSSRLYYTYTTNGTQYEVTASLESSKYGLGGSNDVISNDGGTLASVYEKGSKLGLEPLDYGDSSLVGLWTFDEGTNSIAYDYSGNNATGSWSGSDTHWTSGRIGPSAGLFASSTDYVTVPNQSQLNTGARVTITAWMSTSNSSFGGIIAGKSPWWGPGDYELDKAQDTGGDFGMNAATHIGWTGGTLTSNTWYFLVGTYDGTNMNYYVNGTLMGTQSNPGLTANNSYPFYMGGNVSGSNFTGSIDDVRVYNRALTAAQVAAMYSGGK